MMKRPRASTVIAAVALAAMSALASGCVVRERSRDRHHDSRHEASGHHHGDRHKGGHPHMPPPGYRR